MRLPKIENYKNENLIELVKIGEVEKPCDTIILLNEKDKIKFIKTIERVVRSSQEYKDYVEYLKKEIDMTQCIYFENVSNKNNSAIKIEIHHEPFTLFDITQIILSKWIDEERELNYFSIAEEVMKVHYMNHVGLIPLSKTVHQLVHDGRLFIPLQWVRGRFTDFLEEYEPYISKDLHDILAVKFAMSKDLTLHDTSILDKKYIYLDIEGMRFPQKL